MCFKKDLDLSEAVQLYCNDLTSPEQFDQEFARWQHMCMSKDADKRPTSYAKALKECDSHLFPNIFVLLQIACTLPVTSCQCERNASVLRRLHNFMRAAMTEDRLTSLALMHIHYDFRININEIVDIFAELHPRRMQLSSVLLERNI